MVEITRRALAGASVALAAAPGAAAAKPAPQPATPWPDAVETAGRIRRGEVTAAEVVSEAIARAEALQGPVNFLVNSDFERALAKAAAVTTAAGAGPFAGVPFLIKDLDDYVGLPTRMGSASRLGAPPARSQSPYMNALDRTGLVVLGKSAVPEFGLSATTEPLIGGPTRNPRDVSRSAGGSSGGAAAAVAAGVIPFAQGSDGGGSLRIPAACCALFGFKPSRGRMIGARGETQVTDFGVEHCLSRSVRDSAALFAATEDAGTGARYAPVGLVAEPVRRRLNVGVLIQSADGRAPDAAVSKAVLETSFLLQGLGHSLRTTRWPIDGPQFRDDYLLLWAAGARQSVDDVAHAIGRAPDTRELEPFTLELAEVAARAAPEDLPRAVERLENAAIAYNAWFAAEELDVVLSPVVATPPPPVGFLSPTVPIETLIERLSNYVSYTPLHNVAGAPAMSLPLAWTAEGEPIGVMVAARAGDERTLFELAFELEAARPWPGPERNRVA